MYVCRKWLQICNKRIWRTKSIFLNSKSIAARSWLFKNTKIYIIYCMSTEQSIFWSAIQTSKIYKIVFKKSLLKKVSDNIFSINQSDIYFLIDKNRILNTELFLHIFVLLNSCSCREKIDDCSKYCKLV